MNLILIIFTVLIEYITDALTQTRLSLCMNAFEAAKKQLGTYVVSNCLITGKSGCGKSHVVRYEM